MTAQKRYALTVHSSAARRTSSTAVADLAARSGLHSDLVRRLIALGAVRTSADSPGSVPPDAAARLARLMRLRRDLGLNYAGAILAVELLARIEQLEADAASKRPHSRR